MVIAKFDIKSITNKIRTLTDETLGEVSYGVPSLRELIEINQIKDEGEQAKKVVFIMLHKADETVTPESVEAADSDLVIYMASVLLKAVDFRVSSPDRSPSPTSPP